MAKPCINCAYLIKSVGITKVVYTNWQGEIEVVTTNSLFEDEEIEEDL